jgi:hypothetical protein
MRKIPVLAVCVIIFLIFSSCIDIAENPVFINIINHTEEKISVTNYPFSVDVGSNVTIQVEQGSEVTVTGVKTHRNYGSRRFFADANWEVK